MSYDLTADVEDIGRTEAKAIVRALLQKHGTDLVMGELDLIDQKAKRMLKEKKAQRSDVGWES